MVDRDLTVSRGPPTQPDIDVSERGSLAGLHAYFEPGDWLHLDGALQAGSIEYSTGGDEQTESAARAEVNATMGADAGGSRLFLGVGAERLTTDSPFGEGDRASSSLYLPFGVSRSGPVDGDWYARVRVEARIVVAGREELDSVPGVGDIDVDRSGGGGLQATARLHHAGASVAVEPYLYLLEPADSESTTVSGTSVRLEDMERLAGGVRLIWQF